MPYKALKVPYKDLKGPYKALKGLIRPLKEEERDLGRMPLKGLLKAFERSSNERPLGCL